MKKILFLSLVLLVSIGAVNAQLIQQGGKVYYDTTSSSTLRVNGNQSVSPLNGSGSLGQIYNNTQCGLNYIQSSLMITTRYSPPGSGYPATLNLSGLPCTALVGQAYIWWTISGSTLSGSVTITNPAGVTLTIPAILAGTGPAKCWGEAGTRTFRADVTAAIGGNGNYTFNISNLASEVDGATLMIIYRDLSATYQGTLVINDGCMVNNSGGSLTQTMSGINACGASVAGNAFVIASDLQPNAAANHSTTLNGVTGTYPQNFWNFDVTSTSVFAGQNTANFGINTSSDCYLMAVNGLYFQTTTCATCTPTSALSVTSSKTDISCNGGSNGTATVNVSGGVGPYTYSWSPAGGTGATATGLSAGNYTCTITDATGCNTSTQSFTINQPLPISVSQSQTNVSCNGGSNGTATVNASGGTGALSYLWSPSGGTSSTASGLSQGNYTCTISDVNGCSTTSNFTITEPSALTASQSQTDVTCNGGANGTATVSASGGTGTLTYSWSPSGGNASTASGLSQGNYSCTITDANGCTIVRNFTISQPVALTATQSQTNVSCSGANDGTATVSASGGTGALTYSWSPSGGTSATATGLSQGAYTCTITDANGCSITKSFTITENSPILVTQAQTNVSCNGGNNGSATVSASGGTGTLTYSWSPGGSSATTISGLTQGSYICTITDATGCSVTSSFTVTEPAALSATQSQTDITCNGSANGTATVNPTGGTGTYTYSWSPAGGTSSTATGLALGGYTCTITDANGCQITRSFTISEPVALTSGQSQTNITCNGGADGTATVTASGGTGTLTYSWSPSGGTSSSATGLTQGNYSCTITDANGCTITNNFTITEPVGITATTAQTNVTCNGGNDGSATVTASGGTGTLTYSWSPSGGTSSSASGLTQGNYSCTITDASGCTRVENFTITEPAALSLTFTTVSSSCSASDGSATAVVTGGTGAYTYSWSTGSTSATASSIPAGIYNCTVTDANGCTITNSATVNSAGAVITITATQSNLSCNSSNDGTASVSASGGAPGYSYSWSNGATNDTITNLAAGNYICTVTDQNGCSAAQAFTITEPQAITSVVAQTNASCNGSTDGSATLTISGGSAPYTYSWSSSANPTNSETGLAAGSYNCTITDANGCSIIQNIVISEPLVLTVTQGQTNISCNGGNNGTATVFVTGGTPGYSYSWSNSADTIATIDSLSTGTYTCTITDTNNCVATSVFTITEPAVLALSVSSTNTLCFGSSDGTASATVTGGTQSYTYSWLPAGGSAATASSLSAGTYTVVVADANGCSAIDSVIITEPVAITASTIARNVTCINTCNGTDSIQVSGGTGAFSYLWTPGNLTTPSITNLCPGTYTCTVTDANNCTLTITDTIQQLPTVSATIISSTDITCNGAMNGSAEVTATGGLGGTYTYLWTPGGTSTATATNLSAGTYTVTATDSAGCTASAQVTVSEPLPLAVSITGDTLVCSGSNANLNSSSSGGTTPYTYSWSNGASGSAITDIISTQTVYTVQLIDSNGCSLLSQGYTVDVPAALSGIVSTPDSICPGDTSSVMVTAAGGMGPYAYSWNNTLDSIAGPQVVSPVASTTYIVTVTDLCQVTFTDSVHIHVYPKPTAALTATPTEAVVGAPVQFTSTSVNAAEWLWDFGDDRTSDDENPVHIYVTDGEYRIFLQITSAEGCIDTTSFDFVNVTEETGIPNVFSPNADGSNDVFFIRSSKVEKFEINIFDRWGKAIFHSSTPYVYWDGYSSSGVPISDGTYYFVLKSYFKTGEVKDTTGFITLVR